jgi:cell division protein FtsQ
MVAALPRPIQSLTGLLTLIAVLGLGYAGLWWFANRPLFAIRTVLFEGQAEHLNLPVVKANFTARMKGTFFTADLAEAKQLAESLPWVRRAQISRRWPGTLVVRIEEHVPLARFNDTQLVSVAGETFTVNLDDVLERGQLPQFVGPVGSAALMVRRFSQLQGWLKPLGFVPRQLQLSDRLSWSVALSSGVAMELGRDSTPDAVEQRVRRLVVSWPQAVAALGAPSRVDLRYPDGYAVSAPGLRLKNADGKKGTL